MTRPNLGRFRMAVRKVLDCQAALNGIRRFEEAEMFKIEEEREEKIDRAMRKAALVGKVIGTGAAGRGVVAAVGGMALKRNQTLQVRTKRLKSNRVKRPSTEEKPADGTDRLGVPAEGFSDPGQRLTPGPGGEAT